MSKNYEEILELFLGKIKKSKPKVENIYLFGSQARGSARLDSDYDLLVIVPKKDYQTKDKLYDAAVDVFLEKGADISLKIIKLEDFERMKKLSTPFIQNILKEGIKIE